MVRRQDQRSTCERGTKFRDVCSAKGPDSRARTLYICHINNWLFRTVDIEKSLVTQNSGVLVKGDGTSGNMNWYGVIKRMITLEFPGQKRSYFVPV